MRADGPGDVDREKIRAVLGALAALLGLFPLMAGLTWLWTKPDDLARNVLLIVSGLVLFVGGLLPTPGLPFLTTVRGGIVLLLTSIAWTGGTVYFLVTSTSPHAAPTPIPIIVPTLPPLSSPDVPPGRVTPSP